jgi:hypothetical protein
MNLDILGDSPDPKSSISRNHGVGRIPTVSTREIIEQEFPFTPCLVSAIQFTY